MMRLGFLGPCSMSDLAEALGVPLSTATHTVDRLVTKRLVERRRSSQDRRVVDVELSEQGRKMRQTMAAARLAMAHGWLSPLSPGERQIFLELMAKITESMQPAEHGSAPPLQKVR